MNRYFYYHILYVGMINVMLFVPHILIKERFEGAVSGILASILIGSVLSIVTTVSMRRFPRLGLPEILHRHFGAYVATPLVALAGISWLSGAVIVIFSMTQTMGAFLNPEMNEYLFMALMVFASIFAGSRSSRTVQFASEILVLLSLPLVALIMFKAVTNRQLNWDAIRVVAGHFAHVPSFKVVSAATFFFSGYMSLMLFNRLNPPNFKVRHLWTLPLLGTLFSLFTFFIPIGFHGTMAVEEYIYLWSVTADSMVMKFGFIQRVFFIFLVLYSILSLMFAMNMLHSSMEFFKACSPGYKPQPEQVPVPKINWILCACFGLAAYLYALWANDEKNQRVTEIWLYCRFVLEIVTMLIIAGLAVAAGRKPRASSPTRAASPGE